MTMLTNVSKGDPLTGIGKRMKGNPKRSVVDNIRKKRARPKFGRKAKMTKKAYINIPHYLGDDFHKINLFEPTFKRADFNIDHVFVNFEINDEDIKNRLLARE